MSVASDIIFYVLPLTFLIVVVILFFGQGGMWEDLKDTVNELKDKWGVSWILPRIGIGQEALEADVSVSEEHRGQVLEITRVINTMLGENKHNCFGDFGELSDLGEEGTTLIFEYRGDRTIMTIQGGAGGQQQITELRAEFPGMRPCVIAGRDELVENFFNYFIDYQDKVCGGGPCYPYYQQVDSISIAYRTDNNNANQIIVAGPGFSDGPVNDESDNFESHGWLFTPDGRHICFFPTNYHANNDEDGIANEWFTEGEDDSIPNQVNQQQHFQYCTNQP